MGDLIWIGNYPRWVVMFAAVLALVLVKGFLAWLECRGDRS